MSEESQTGPPAPRHVREALSRASVKAIYDVAVTLDASEWSSFLDLRCGSDDELRREVESLLAAQSDSSGFWENSLPGGGPLAAGARLPEQQVSRIGTRIGAYQIEREIGHGGMGTVYLANRADEEFRKRVAIKVIRVERLSDFMVRRFRQERQILAKLEHPHVARLIDGGTTAWGLPYLVMEFVDGEIVTHFCDSHGLAVKERCELFLKICSAVQYAHERNIIHRDLKPANILVEKNGVPKLLDFGVAKMLELENPGASKDATLAGMRMLTPAYASPEQLQGDPATPQNDVYSLGIVLYELLCGERPSLKTVQQGSSDLNLREGHLSPGLRAILFHAIRLDPSERYPTIAAFAEAIHQHLQGFRSDGAPGETIAAGADRISIGVLPFRELGQDTKADPFLRSAITDALITRLSKVDRLSVRPTSAVLRYAEGENPVHAARELRVRYLLEGTFHTAGDQVRLNVQLVSSDTGQSVWAARFDEQSSDLLRLEDSISEQIAYVLIPQLTGGERFQLSRSGTANPQAHQAYLRGRYHWSRSASEPEELAKALLCFMQAIAEDPSYALAHAGVADYYVRLALWGGVPPAESFAAGLNAAGKALALDPGLGEAHASLGFCLWAYNGDYAAAEREFNIAIAYNTDSPNAYHWFGLLNSARGRPELALANLERAYRIDPNSPVIATALGFVYYNDRQYARSLELLNIAVRERQTSGVIQEMLSWCHLQLGDLEHARECAKRAVALSDRNPSSLAALARAEASTGKSTAAADIGQELETLRTKRYVSGYDRASVHFAAGNVPQALSCLEEAYEARDWWVCWIAVDPRWDPLRGEPRFAELVARTQPARRSEKTETIPAPLARRKRVSTSTIALIVAAALTLLAAVALLLQLHPTLPPFSNPQFTRVPGNGTTGLVALSPDGAEVAYTTSEKGSTRFWRRKLGASGAEPLAAPVSGDVVSLEFTGNGTQVAYVLRPPGQPYRRRLFLLPLSGGAPAAVLGDLAGPVGLSHDGAQAAVLRPNRSLNRDELWITDIRTGRERLLSSRRYPDHFSSEVQPVWSRDGRLIAFPLETKDSSGFLIQISAVEVATGRERHVRSPRWLWVDHLAWVKGASGIAIVARPQGSSFRQLWYVGYPSGPSRRLGNNIESYNGASLSDAGDALVSVQLQMLSNIYLGPDRNSAQPLQITPGTGRYFDLSWTTDGRILYASDSTGEAEIWSIKPDGTEQRQITSGGGLKWAPAESPDGRYIAFHSNQSGSWNIWRCEIDGSHPVQITFGPLDSNWPDFTPDSKNIVFHQTDAKGVWSTWSVPVGGGTPAHLTAGTTSHPAVSRKDGRIAAWYSKNVEDPEWKIGIFAPGGGEPLQVLTPVTPIPDSQLAWTPAGDAITCLSQQNGVWNLWLVPVDGRPVQRLTSLTAGQIYSFDWSNDGRLAFSHGITSTDMVIVRDKSGAS